MSVNVQALCAGYPRAWIAARSDSSPPMMSKVRLYSPSCISWGSIGRWVRTAKLWARSRFLSPKRRVSMRIFKQCLQLFQLIISIG